MSDEGPSLDIEINAIGAREAAGEISGVADAARESGEAVGETSREAGAGFRELGKSAREARELTAGIGEAAEGGVKGFLGMTSAARGFFGLLKGSVEGNPIGLLLLALSAAVGLFTALAKKSKETSDEMAKDVKDTADRQKAALDILAAAQEKTLAKQGKEVEALIKQYDNLIARMDAASARTKAIDDARKGLDLAQVDQKEQEETAKAKLRGATPEELDAIKGKFSTQRDSIESKSAGTDIANRQLRAQLDQQAAQKEINAILEKRETLQNTLAEKEKTYGDALKASTAANKEFIEDAAQRSEIAAIDAKTMHTGKQDVDPLSDEDRASLLARRKDLSDQVFQRQLDNGAKTQDQIDKERADVRDAAEVARKERDDVQKQLNKTVEATDPALEAADQKRASAETQLRDVIPLDAQTAAAKARNAAAVSKQNVLDLTRSINNGKTPATDANLRTLGTDRASAEIAKNTAETAKAVESLVAVLKSGAVGGQSGPTKGSGGTITKGGEKFEVGTDQSDAVSDQKSLDYALKNLSDGLMITVGVVNEKADKAKRMADDFRLP